MALAAVILVVAGGAAAVVVRADTLSLPLPRARVVTALPGAVGGSAPAVAMPAGGEAVVATAGGVVLASSGAQQAEPLASVTKVMTAYVVLRDHPLAAGQAGPSITVSAADAATLPQRALEDQSVVAVRAGEVLSEQQALEALLIPSADNVADILAAWDAGTQAAFVARMNATATGLGMTHTTYAGPSGYDPASVSTPADQLLLARAAMTQPAFASIVAMPSAVLPVAGRVTNYNSLVGRDGFSGIKTGSTGAAGGCLVWTVTRPVAGNPLTLYGVVLGQRNGPFVAAALSAAQSITDSAFHSLATRTVVAAGTRILEIDRAGRSTYAVTSGALTTVDPPGTPVRVSVRTGPAGPLGVPATVELVTPDGSSKTAVRQVAPLPAPTFGWRLSHAL